MSNNDLLDKIRNGSIVEINVWGDKSYAFDNPDTIVSMYSLLDKQEERIKTLEHKVSNLIQICNSLSGIDLVLIEKIEAIKTMIDNSLGEL